jgi:hypothetical protein
MQSPWDLCLIDIKGFGRKLRYDLAREVVVLLCVTVLLALFYYVFNDFINEKLADVSQKLKIIVSYVVALAMTALFYGYVRQSIRHAMYDTPNVSSFAKWMGVSEGVTKKFMFIKTALTLGALFAVNVFTIQKIFAVIPLHLNLVANIGAILVTLLSLKIKYKAAEYTEEKIAAPWQSAQTAKMMFLYRLDLLLKRGSSARRMIIFAGFAAIASCVMAYLQTPMVALVLMFFVSGFIASTSLALLLAEDLKQAWVDKSLGVSHENFVRVYSHMSMLVGLALLAVTIAILLPLALTQHSLTLVNIAQLGFICATSSLVFPAIMFQIEPRRAVIQMMVSFLIGLFVITAIYAHILSIVLIPLVTSQSQAMQLGRFYRA